jgi:acetyl esterase/lipase
MILGERVLRMSPNKFRVLSLSLVACVLAAAPIAAQTMEEKRVVYCPSENVRVFYDIEYARYGRKSLTLDLYLPIAHAERIPGVVVVHGGGWAGSDSKQFAHVAAALAERGVAAAAIEYRTASEASFPGAIQDVKAAIRWMRANAERFGIIDRELGILGGSSGAYMALFAGVTDGLPFYEGSGGHPGVSSRVQGVVGMATPTDPRRLGEAGQRVVERFIGKPLSENPAVWALASPVSHVDDLDPMVLLMHSRTDEAVRPEQATEFATLYRGAGSAAEVELIAGAPHAFWNYHPWFAPAMDRVAEFFRTMRN